MILSTLLASQINLSTYTGSTLIVSSMLVSSLTASSLSSNVASISSIRNSSMISNQVFASTLVPTSFTPNQVIFSSLTVSSMGINTLTPSVALDIQYGNINISSILSTVYSTAGTYSVPVPYYVTGMYFEMIGAGGAGFIANPPFGLGIGGTGGYMTGSIQLPSTVSTLKIVVGSAGTATTGGTASGASYITVGDNVGPLFAIAGAGGASGSSTFGAGGAGGGGTGAFISTSGTARAPGGNNGCTGTGGSQSGATTGGRGTDSFCNTVSSLNGESYPGILGLYEQSNGGSSSGQVAGGSGYAGGGAGALSGGGGSSYYDLNSTIITTSYGATTAIPGGLLSGYGRSNQSGYVSFTFFQTNETSLFANGDISCRHVFQTQNSTLNQNNFVANSITVSSLFRASTSNVSTLNVNFISTGRVFMGTGAPTYLFEIQGAGVTTSFSTGFRYGFGGPGSNFPGPIVDPIHIKGDADMWANIYFATSDRRIKQNIQEIDDDRALQVVRKLKPVTYEYIDQVKHHNEREYGFIAQDVAPCLPYAIKKETDFIPNLYDLADWSTMTESTSILTLRNKTTTDIQPNDFIKLIDLQEQSIVVNVLEKQERSMLVNTDLAKVVSKRDINETDQANGIDLHTIFVYGKRVEDLHVLEKKAIFCVGTAALQEMDRTILSHHSTLLEHQLRLDQLQQRWQQWKHQQA
jgi:hypothetical protein